MFWSPSVAFPGRASWLRGLTSRDLNNEFPVSFQSPSDVWCLGLRFRALLVQSSGGSLALCLLDQGSILHSAQGVDGVVARARLRPSECSSTGPLGHLIWEHLA